MIVWCRKERLAGKDALVPIDQDGQEAFAKLGRTRAGHLRVEVKQPRNPDHHRLFFKMLAIVQENLPDYLAEVYPTVEALLTAVKIGTGYCDPFIDDRGNVVYVPRSISYEAMDQTAFRPFYNAAVDLILRRWLPGLNRRDLDEQVFQLIGVRPPEPPKPKRTTYADLVDG